MNNLSKYRRLSVIAVTSMAILLLCSLAAFRNAIFNADVKNEGWVIAFVLLLFVAGLLLFRIAFVTTDVNEPEHIRKEAYNLGKTEALQEVEKKEKEKEARESQRVDLQQTVAAIFTGLQGIRTEGSLCNKVLTNLGRELGFVQGIIYTRKNNEENFAPAGEYALTDRKPQPFKPGDTLPGQAALNQSMMVIYDIPENYFTVTSGLGSAYPRYLVLYPVVLQNQTIAVLELGAFKKPDENTSKLLGLVANELGTRLNKFAVA